MPIFEFGARGPLGTARHALRPLLQRAKLRQRPGPWPRLPEPNCAGASRGAVTDPCGSGRARHRRICMRMRNICRGFPETRRTLPVWFSDHEEPRARMLHTETGGAVAVAASTSPIGPFPLQVLQSACAGIYMPAPAPAAMGSPYLPRPLRKTPLPRPGSGYFALISEAPFYQAPYPLGSGHPSSRPGHGDHKLRLHLFLFLPESPLLQYY